MKPLFYTVYQFMSHDLRLEGVTKEVFAVIFGFWYRTRAPVDITYDRFIEMIGTSRPSISHAIKTLESQGLISTTKYGRRSVYAVHIDEGLLVEFESVFKKKDSSNWRTDDTRVSSFAEKPKAAKEKRNTRTCPMNSMEISTSFSTILRD